VAKLAADKAKQFFEEKSNRVEQLAKQNKLIADNAAAAPKFREQFGEDQEADSGAGATAVAGSADAGAHNNGSPVAAGELIEERDVLVDENGRIVSTLPPSSSSAAASAASAARAPSANSRRSPNNRLRHMRSSSQRRPAAAGNEWVVEE
jgi:hypothetical protein